MKQVVSFSLVLSLIFPSALPLHHSIASELDVNESSESLLTQRRGGSSRGGGGNRGGRRNINRSGLGSRGSARINRPNTSRPGNRQADQFGNRPSTRASVKY